MVVVAVAVESQLVVQDSGRKGSADIGGIEVEVAVTVAIVDRLRNSRSWHNMQLGSLLVSCDPMRSVAIVVLWSSASCVKWCAEVVRVRSAVRS